MVKLCGLPVFLKHIFDRMFGLVGEKGCLERGQLLVSLQATETLGGLHHASGGPAQRHIGVAPSLRVTTDAAHRPHHVLDRIGAGKRSPEFERQAEFG